MNLRRSLETKIPPPAYGLLTALLMWLCSQHLPALSIAHPVTQTIGIAMMILGVSIDITALGQFIKRRTTPNPFTPEKANTIVVSGLYRFSRNPMYLGLFILLTGWALNLSNLASLACLALFGWLINQMQIIPEERILTEKFGEAYLNYQQQVRRWI